MQGQTKDEARRIFGQDGRNHSVAGMGGNDKALLPRRKTRAATASASTVVRLR